MYFFIFDKYTLLFQLWPFQFFFKNLNCRNLKCPNLNSRASDAEHDRAVEIVNGNILTGINEHLFYKL